MSKEEIKKYLEKLIDKTKEELVGAKVQEWIYAQEYANPKHMGKEKAMESLSIYQKRSKYLEEFITIYEQYAKDHEIKL